VGFFLDRVLAAATGGVQYICYSERPQQREDRLTERLRAHACAWRTTIGVPDRQLAELIRADGIDILTDLAGHTAGNRLDCFRFRPAPVQVHWAGYCHSIPLMDYSIWDPIQVPVSQERWFVERIVRLPDVRWCYAAPDYAPAVSDPPVLQRGYVTFGSFNNLAKVNSAVIDLWLRVLEAVPRSRLLLSWPTLADPNERARLASAFSARGLDLCRLELRRGSREHAGVLGEYSEVDIALDAFPFSGCLTTCEALWMGLPVVTWPHSRPVSRQSQALLTAIGRTEWVARDAGNYVQIAASLAADSDRLVALRREQRARMAASPLCDGPRFAHNLEEIYRTVWRTFAAGEAPRRIEVADRID
jgi:predicted O-linked N-acetylglucosamine transferase (SPINDLY family)